MNRQLVIWMLISIISSSLSIPAVAINLDIDVFVGGAEGPEGTPFYRIPGMTVAADGSVLAFAEGRRSGGDPGAAGLPIDLVMKRSTDGGRSWSPLQVLAANPLYDFDDPTPMVDPATGTVHLLYSRVPDGCGLFCVPPGIGDESMNVFHTQSSDHGQNWSPPINISADVKELAWRGIVAGPGSGISLQWQTNSTRNGRLVAPASVNANENLVLYSDDGGGLWQAGSLAQNDLNLSGFDGNENEVVELTNGDLLLNARQNSGSTRRMFLSSDGGETWVDSYSGDYPITRVDGSMIRYSAGRSGDDRDRILFSGPSGSPVGSGNGRSNITVWTSYDEGLTFTNPVQLESGFAAYSVLSKLQDDSIGLLYEATGTTRIRYLNFDLPRLENDYHPAAMTHFDGFANEIDALRGGVGWSGAWSADNVDTVDGGLEFPRFSVARDNSRVSFRGGHLTRSFSQEFNLDENGDHFFSLFIRQDSDGLDDVANEWLDVRLLDDGIQRFAFGVASSEAFFVRNADSSSNQLTGIDELELDTEYLLLAKVEASGDLGGADQVFLAIYDDPANVPMSEAEIVWNLAGSLGDNYSGTIDSIFIGGGQSATWNVDGLRVGTSLEGVLVDNGLTGVAGDINQDGVLDMLDRDAFVMHWRTSGHATLFEMISHGDFTQDGKTTLPDAFFLHQAFQDAGIPISFDQLFIPEPSSFLMLLWGIFLTNLFRSKRRDSAAFGG